MGYNYNVANTAWIYQESLLFDTTIICRKEYSIHMYKKPTIMTLSKDEIAHMIQAKASGCTGYCSKGATYCGSGTNYGNICDSTVIYCSGGNYTGTHGYNDII